MALPMWVQHGTMLQIPHESLMGCPYRTHINTHLWPMWVLYLLLAGYMYLISETPHEIHIIISRGRQHSFVEIDEIFSMVILSLPLIQEGKLSVSSERMCTILVNRLED